MARWGRIGVVLVMAAVAIAAAVAFPLDGWTGRLVAWMQAAGAIGVLAFAAAYILATVLLLPGALLTAGAGLAYGPLWGTLLVSPVSVAAATLAFTLGRTVARSWVARRTEGDSRFRAVDAAIGRHGLRIVVLLRLSPVFPFNVLNYALGLTGVRLRDYVIGSFVGMLPGTLLYVYLGWVVGSLAAPSDGAGAAGPARQALLVVGLVATIAVTAYVTRVARRALSDELATKEPTRSCGATPTPGPRASSKMLVKLSARAQSPVLLASAVTRGAGRRVLDGIDQRPRGRVRRLTVPRAASSPARGAWY